MNLQKAKEADATLAAAVIKQPEKFSLSVIAK
jgi:hypothetical protein